MATSALAAAIARWRAHPVDFVREVFKAEPDSWQVDVLEAFPHHRRMALKACKGPGKTCVLAWLVYNFMLTRTDAKVACTSISADNLADCLWAELALWRRRSDLISSQFEWQKTRIFARESPNTWFASARSWSKTADATQQADTLAGLHQDNIMFVLDEVGSIPDAVMAAAEAALGTIGGDKHLVIAGNPTMLTGPLYRASTSDRKNWHVTEITSDPDDPKRTPRVTVEWAQKQIDTYGRENPWVLVNVFGRFPPSSMNSLLGPDDVTAAFARKMHPDSISHAAVVLGVDPARYGDDRTVIFPRQGQAAFAPTIMRKQSTIEVADRVIYLFHELKAEAVFIDMTGGHGNGICDLLRAAGIRVIEVQFSGSPNKEMYFNKRSEIWWEMSKWVSGASLPNIPELVRELTEPTFSYQKDKFRLEEKDQIKERLGYSPDLADALACTFACPIAPAALALRQEIMASERRQVVRGAKFDPLGRVRNYRR